MTSKWIKEDGTRMKCFEEGCERDVYCKGLCSKHYSRKKRPESTRYRQVDLDSGEKLPCKVDGCDLPPVAKLLCDKHYSANKRHGTPFGSSYEICPVHNCGRIKIKKSLVCKRCNQLAWRYSISPETVKLMFEPDNFKCSNKACGVSKNLHMDHSHLCCPPGSFPQTSKVSCGDCVRGWLCRMCNLALGKLQENPRIIQGLLDFLRESK